MGVRLNNVAGAEADTLQSVTDRGATTTNALKIPQLNLSNGNKSIDIYNSLIYAIDGVSPLISWGNTSGVGEWVWFDTIGPVLHILQDTQVTNLVDSTGTYSADIENRDLFDALGVSALNYASRLLKDSNGDTCAGWEDNAIILSDYTNVASPVEGMLSFDFTNHVLKYYNGSTWV